MLTPRSRVFIEKLTVAYLVKKYSVLFEKKKESTLPRPQKPVFCPYRQQKLGLKGIIILIWTLKK